MLICCRVYPLRKLSLIPTQSGPLMATFACPARVSEFTWCPPCLHHNTFKVEISPGTISGILPEYFERDSS